MLDKYSNEGLSFLLARLIFGVNFFAHGLVRLPKIEGFSDWLVTEFVNTMIPQWMIRPYGIALIFMEFFVGIFIIFGLKTRNSLVFSMLILCSLTFGACMQEDWKRVGVIMVYVAINYMLIRDYSKVSNLLSLDQLLDRRSLNV